MIKPYIQRLTSRINATLDDIPLSRKGVAVVSIPLLVLLITLVLMAWHEKVSQMAQDRVRHSLQIKAQIYRVQASITDSETAVRGFLLWRDHAYLAPFDEARIKLPGELTQLQALVQNNADQTSAVTALESAARRKIEAMREMINHPTAARRLNNPATRESFTTMQELRQVLREMEVTETSLLNNRTRQYDNLLARLNAILILLFLLAILCGLTASYVVSTGILNRVHRLEVYARKVSRGQPSEMQDSGQDELGLLGRSVQVMTNNLLAREEALRQTREQLQNANRRLTAQLNEIRSVNEELEAFSYSVSHDLRAPLRHVSGFTDLLRKNSEELSQKNQRYIGIITESVKQMGVLIDELLAFSRMGRTALNLADVDLNELVGQVLTSLSSDLEERDIEWKINYLPVVQADPTMLRMVLQNLIDNAVKYTRGKQPAVIEITQCDSENPEMICIMIRDNGVGFDMKYIEKLFGVFQRLHNAEEYEGTGIGLATVRRIIKRHGGQVRAESEVGKGAAFYIELPGPLATEQIPRSPAL